MSKRAKLGTVAGDWDAKEAPRLDPMALTKAGTQRAPIDLRSAKAAQRGERVQFNVRISLETKETVSRLMAERGLSATQIVEDAIRLLADS